jgi:undecaprenyl diphosphate synthase
MLKSSIPSVPLHVAVIMDGNGRWASLRGWPRIAGHRAGADAVRRVVESAPNLGVDMLTLYAFSSDNWKRPREETSALMKLLRTYLREETARCVETGVRIEVIGRRDRLPAMLVPEIEAAEHATSNGQRLHLRIAVDYSSRDSLLNAARRAQKFTREEFSTLLGGRDVDLVVRTSGEQRLSDFLLWECAYAEMHFTPVMWPDFGGAELREAVESFRSRERRFGAVSTGFSEAGRSGPPLRQALLDGVERGRVHDGVGL